MWRIFENIVFFVSNAVLDFLDFCPDANKSIDKSIDFALVFTLGWLNHQTADQWPAHSRGMEPVVHKSLGNVLFRDTNLLLVRRKINDELVGDSAFGAKKSDLEVFSEALSHVVGIKDGQLGSFKKAFRAHHLYE